VNRGPSFRDDHRHSSSRKSLILIIRSGAERVCPTMRQNCGSLGTLIHQNLSYKRVVGGRFSSCRVGVGDAMPA
jgi:hypothetical protein